MLVLPQMVKVKWNQRNKKWYEEKGHVFTAYKDEFEVDIRDLQKNAPVIIKLWCDYCLEDGTKTEIKRTMIDYSSKQKVFPKDCCKKCSPKKVAEINLIKYGVESTNQLEKVKNKKKETFLKNYGAESYLQSEEGKEKIANTNFVRYGVINPFQSEEIKEKIKQTNLDKYGYEHASQSPEVREKVIQTNIERFGVPVPSMNEKIKEKIKLTNIEKYGVDNPMKADEIKNKLTQTIFELYGVENVFQSEEIKEKSKVTMVEKYGVEHNMQNEEFRNKAMLTNIERYGVPNPLQNEDIKEKVKNTNLERYGTTRYSQTEEFLEKFRSTNMERLGVEYPMQSLEVRTKSMLSMFENGSGRASKQQIYLCNLFNGMLNFPVSYVQLDIAFPESKLFIEYDGGGHNLSVKSGQISKEDFDKREMRRSFAMIRNGWKEIRIISRNDSLPFDEKLLEMLQFAKDYLNTGRHFIKFDIDEGVYITSKYIKGYDFGELRYITKNDLKEDLTENVESSFCFI